MLPYSRPKAEMSLAVEKTIVAISKALFVLNVGLGKDN